MEFVSREKKHLLYIYQNICYNFTMNQQKKTENLFIFIQRGAGIVKSPGKIWNGSGNKFYLCLASK